VIYDGDALRQVVSLLQVVCRQHHGQAVLARQPRDLAPHVRTRLRIQASGRLVQEEHPWLVDQSHRHVELALHATGESARDTVACVGQVEAFEQSGDTPPQLGARHTVELALQCQVLGSRGLQVHRRLLRDEADHAPHTLGLAHHIVTGDAGAAGGRPGERREYLHNRGFAGAVWPEQREHAAGANAEADAFERLDAPTIHLPEPLGLHNGRRAG
jgi:hypothetical protein